MYWLDSLALISLIVAFIMGAYLVLSMFRQGVKGYPDSVFPLKFPGKKFWFTFSATLALFIGLLSYGDWLKSRQLGQLVHMLEDVETTVRVNGLEISNQKDFKQEITQLPVSSHRGTSPGREFQLILERNGESLSLLIMPDSKLDNIYWVYNESNIIGRLGIFKSENLRFAE